MHYFEQKLNGKTVYEGRIVDIHMDDARLADGRIVKREVVEHPEGVAVLPVDDELNCYMVSQFRYPFQIEMLEVPAGMVEKNEEHKDSAVRELSEETGFTADNLFYYGKTVLSPGYSTECVHIYIATGLHEGQKHPDDGEFLNVCKYSLNELRDMVKKCEITDAKSIIAILVASDMYL